MLIAVAEKRLCTVIRTVAVAAVAAPPPTSIESEIQLTHIHTSHKSQQIAVSRTTRRRHSRIITISTALTYVWLSQPTTQIHTILDIKFFQNDGQITRKRSHNFDTVPITTMFIQRRLSCTWT